MHKVDTAAVSSLFLLTLRINLVLPVTENSTPVWLKRKDLQEKEQTGERIMICRKLQEV